jgi:hypothetical protein
MNLKLPLKAKGNFFGMKESYTEIEDANGTIFRVSAPHDSTVNTQKTVQFIVSAVNNYEAMQAVLDDCALLAHRVKMQCYSCECYEEGDCHTNCVSDYARKIYDDLSALRKPKKTSADGYRHIASGKDSYNQDCDWEEDLTSEDMIRKARAVLEEIKEAKP